MENKTRPNLLASLFSEWGTDQTSKRKPLMLAMLNSWPRLGGLQTGTRNCNVMLWGWTILREGTFEAFMYLEHYLNETCYMDLFLKPIQLLYAQKVDKMFSWFRITVIVTLQESYVLLGKMTESIFQLSMRCRHIWIYIALTC